MGLPNLFVENHGETPSTGKHRSKMRKIQSFVGLLVLLVAAACSLLPQSGPAPTATPEPSQTPNPTATTLPTPISTATPAGSPTPTLYAPVELTLSVDNVNLRTNPGFLFAVRTLLPVDTHVKILEQSVGGEWLHIQTDDGTDGWLYTVLVAPDLDLSGIPAVTPADVPIITGKVADEAGKPVSGITFSISQGSGSTEQTNTATTDASGQFYAYMPAKASGMWAVIYTAISCTSNKMDKDCNCVGGTCGTANPSAINVILPQSEDVLFTWK
jgi:hypothetical protein